MRVLIYGLNYAPELAGIGKYTGELAQWLAARGHDVSVVTAPPYYPDWRVWSGYKAWLYRRNIQERVRVIRCPLWVPKEQSGVKRILHLISFAVSSAPAVLGKLWRRPDVIVVVAPAFFCSLLGWFSARLIGAKCWLHIQDFEVDAAFELGLLNGSSVRKAVLAVERWLLRRFDAVSTISKRMAIKLHAKGVPAERTYLFPNWVDTQSIRPLPRASAMREALGISGDATVALYSGNMGAKQGLDILASAAVRLQHVDNLMFVFCGQGAGRPALEKACSGLENVRFLDLQPIEQLNELLNLGDIHLLPQKADAADLVMPSKLTGILASGHVVVATAAKGTELYQVVHEAGGLCTGPGDDHAFALAIRALAGSPEARQDRGVRARKYAEASLARDQLLGAFERNLMRELQGAEVPRSV